MSPRLRLDDVRRARESDDPTLVGLVAALAGQPDEAPETPIREGAATFAGFLAEIRSKAFFKARTPDEQRIYRSERMLALEAPDAEVPAPERLRLHEVIAGLWGDDGPYARTHARDLPVDELVRLANNDEAAVRKLAADLLSARDPRAEVGLEAWGRLLESRHGYLLASAALRKHFGARELTPEWSRDRLMTQDRQAFGFIQTLLLQVHPAATLGPGYFPP